VLLALPASAVAGTCAPPGNSGVNQYVEVVPGVGCNHPSSGPGSGGHSSGGHLSSTTTKQLAASGGAGKAVQQLVANSGTGGTGSAKTHHHKSSGAATTSPGRPVSASGHSPIAALLHPILTGAGSGGLGLLLPIGLAFVVAFMAALVLVRRRRLTS
jgi:hypothetical protein